MRAQEDGAQEDGAQEDGAQEEDTEESAPCSDNSEIDNLIRKELAQLGLLYPRLIAVYCLCSRQFVHEPTACGT